MIRMLCLALVLLAAAAPAHAADELSRFMGAYVGRANMEAAPGFPAQLRDIDVVIEPYKRGGFRLRTISVELVDGRRDVVGVRRLASESLFLPSNDGKYFVESDEAGPFRDREDLQPMGGDPIRWAQIEPDKLTILAFVLLPDGRYELQLTERRLTKEGMELTFERIDDGKLVRRATGHAIRAQP